MTALKPLTVRSDQVSRSVMSNSLPPLDCRTPGFPVHHQLLELTQTHLHRVDDAIQWSHPCRPPLLPPSIFPSIRVFSNESVLCIRWPKYGASASTSNLPMNIQDLFPLGNQLDLFAVQGTLKSLLQHHSSKASILRCSAFFIMQFSRSYISVDHNKLENS